MQKNNRLRTMLTSWVSLSMVFGLLGTNFFSGVAKAAMPDLIISEVNFLGSSVNPSDDWIELYNPGLTDINLSVTNYKLVEGATEIANLNSGIIKSKSFFLVANSTTTPPTPTSLNISVDANFSALTDLSNIGGTYSVTKAGIAIDTLNTLPFVEEASCSAKNIAEQCITASVNQTTNGLAVTKSVGKNFAGAIEQYGTPANQLTSITDNDLNYGNNPIIGDAVITAISPISPSALDTPIISGQRGAANSSVMLRFKDQTTLNETTENIITTSEPTFSKTISSALSVGTYLFSTHSSDALGNRSIEKTVVKNYTVSKLTSTVEALPAYTNKTQVIIKGKTEPGARYMVENLTTGYSPATYTNVETDGSFSATIDLQINSANSLKVKTLIGSLNAADPILVSITQDSVLPSDLIADKVKLTASTPNLSDYVTGLAGAYQPYEAGIIVEAYSDQLLTKLIGTSTVLPDGSFEKIDLGDNKYAVAYLVASDLAGNKSAIAVKVENPISFVTSNLTINGQIGSVTQNSAKITWEMVPTAVGYRLKYMPVGGSFSNPINVCFTDTCSLDSTIIGLNPNTDYIIAIAAVDANGNESTYTQFTFKTIALAVVENVVNVEETSIPTTTPSRVVVDDSEATEVIATPTPEPADEEGDVKSTNETNNDRNWTPWIILGILIGLAILATSGYFYWFGGEAGEAAMASVIKNSETPSSKKEEETKANKKDKRW